MHINFYLDKRKIRQEAKKKDKRQKRKSRNKKKNEVK